MRKTRTRLASVVGVQPIQDNMPRWKRSGNSMVLTFREDEVTAQAVAQWKRLLSADNNLEHTQCAMREGRDWATMEILDKFRDEKAKAAANWKSFCHAMGWKAPNGRTYYVHIEPAAEN